MLMKKYKRQIDIHKIDRENVFKKLYSNESLKTVQADQEQYAYKDFGLYYEKKTLEPEFVQLKKFLSGTIKNKNQKLPTVGFLGDFGVKKDILPDVM